MGLNLRDITQVFELFNFLKLANFIVIGNFDGEFRTFQYNSLEFDEGLFDRPNFVATVNDAFPDKLRDLKGYTYRALVWEDYKIRLVNGTARGEEL